MAAQETGLMVVPASQPREVASQWTKDDLEALKATVAKDCDIPQFKVFVAAAARLGLDPFARQIVPIVQGGRMTPQVTIDGFRLIAERTHKYRGQIGPFWCDKDGEWRDVWLSDAAPVACKVGVLRSDFAEPMWGVARTKAYAKGGQWTTMPDVMIAKVAESLALRKAFPQELSGAYTEEELAQAAEDVTPRQAPTPMARAMATARPAAQAEKRITREDVSRLANRLQVAADDRRKLFDKHGGDIAAVYAELQTWEPTVTFSEAEVEEVPSTLEGLDVRPLVP